MYTLTLTSGERQAFDWVGDRYACGNEVANILRECMGPDDEWGQEGDYTFQIPEHAAWEIDEVSRQDMEGGHSRWPCFNDDLRAKLDELVDSIV